MKIDINAKIFLNNEVVTLVDEREWSQIPSIGNWIKVGCHRLVVNRVIFNADNNRVFITTEPLKFRDGEQKEANELIDHMIKTCWQKVEE
jgi:hypothetical protein